MSEPGPACLRADCLTLAAFDRGWSVCARHGERAGRELAELGSEYERLSAAPALGVWRTDGSVSGGTPKHLRSPANLDVIVARDARSRPRDEEDIDGNPLPGVLGFIVAAAAQVAEAFAEIAPVTFTGSRVVLAMRLDWLLAQDWAGEFADELHGCWRTLRRINAAPTRPRKSTCRACGSVALSWDGSTASCADCGGSWSGLAVLRPA